MSLAQGPGEVCITEEPVKILCKSASFWTELFLVCTQSPIHLWFVVFVRVLKFDLKHTSTLSSIILSISPNLGYYFRLRWMLVSAEFWLLAKAIVQIFYWPKRHSLFADKQLASTFSPSTLFSCIQNFKTLQDSPSHRIFERMHEVLNVAKQNN